MMLVDVGEVSAAAAQMGHIADSLREGHRLVSAASAVPAPGADRVSEAFTELFNAYGRVWRRLLDDAYALQERFAAAFSSSARSYSAAESANTANVSPGAAPLDIVMGGTGTPFPGPRFLTRVSALYLGGAHPSPLFTPEEMYPLVGASTYEHSLVAGTADLGAALLPQLRSGRDVTVFGYSQSSAVATEEIRALMAAGSPYTHQLSFVLTGDPNNPNGGLAERFNGLDVFGVTFNGATPADSPYPTAIYTRQYDGVADFPAYPLNAVSDLNAVCGIAFGAHDYTSLPAWEVSGAAPLPVSPGYHGDTHYYMMLTQDLPLVRPLRDLLPRPYGDAVADLLQPDLRVVADLGYSSGGYANTPTPASLIEIPNVPVVARDLAAGTNEGINAFLVDLELLPRSDYPLGQYPFSPVLDPGLNLNVV